MKTNTTTASPKKNKKWLLAEKNEKYARDLQEKLGISELLSHLLVNRGICLVEEAFDFLNPLLENLHDPFLFKDMRKAVERVCQAVARQEKILLYGDYDVDGISGVCFLTKILRPLMPKNLFYYIPKRLDEGYGLHSSAIEKAKAQGISLIITVDCGINSVEEVRLAASLGIEVIITDHHEPQEKLPDCLAIINPKCDENYPFRYLAGVGVAYKLGQGLAERLPITRKALYANLDLVALGTVADIVPLKGENRILVKFGLEKLNNSDNLGLRALIEATRLTDQKLNTSQVGYILAPRINATGRLGDPSLSVKLLLARNYDEARYLADKLCDMNEKRQAIEAEVLREVRMMIAKRPALNDRYFWVFAGEGWHTGVIGIVASRLIEEFYRPVILISLAGGEGRGSGRSIPGFHLFEALEACKDLFITFGGHEMAAGLTIKEENIPILEERLTKWAADKLTEENLIPSLFLEKEINLSELDLRLCEEISMLEPYGPDNPKPILLCRGINLLDYRPVGENGKHLKLKVKESQTELEGIGFNMGEWISELAAANLLDLAFTPEENNWQGKKTVQLNLKDIKMSVES